MDLHHAAVGHGGRVDSTEYIGPDRIMRRMRVHGQTVAKIRCAPLMVGVSDDWIQRA
jgi:hypothetical protein